jgi:phosphinothricin acetyltransferase
MKIDGMTAADWPAVAQIYREGIATGQATFAPAPPESFEDFADGKLMECACAAREEGEELDPSAGPGQPRVYLMAGWATLAKVSDRCVYAGVAEVSVYVAAAARGRGVGDALLRELIARAETAGVWTMQAGIFPENTASLRLHARHGFREVGRRERLGKMPAIGPRAGQWRDVLLLERRSAVAGA